MLKLTKAFHALGDPTREEIMRQLRADHELNVSSLTARLTVSQPTVSQHLRVLSEAGVVVSRKVGREVYYSICSTQIYDIIDKLLELYRR